MTAGCPPVGCISAAKPRLRIYASAIRALDHVHRVFGLSRDAWEAQNSSRSLIRESFICTFQ